MLSNLSNFLLFKTPKFQSFKESYRAPNGENRLHSSTEQWATSRGIDWYRICGKNLFLEGIKLEKPKALKKRKKQKNKNI